MVKTIEIDNNDLNNLKNEKGAISRQLTILGRGECGKTSILYRLTHGQFATEIPATPIESRTVTYDVSGVKINLKIFDTSGQDDYSRFRALTLPVSNYILVCYSVIEPMSFSEVEDTIVSMVETKAPKHAKIILCATKIDMRKEEDIGTQEGLNLAERIGAYKFFECSSLTGENILEIFDFIKKDIYANYNKSENGWFRNLFCCV